MEPAVILVACSIDDVDPPNSVISLTGLFFIVPPLGGLPPLLYCGGGRLGVKDEFSWCSPKFLNVSDSPSDDTLLSSIAD